MKKLFVSLLAIAGLVACTNDEVVSVQQGNPIAFDTFVENTTRVGYDSSNLNGFDVWAFMDNVEGVVLTDEDVTGGKGNFSYVNTQYWVPGHTYYFAALAPMNSANVVKTLATGDDALKGLGTLVFTNVNGTEDLLYAATKVEANDQQGAVTFQFNHLLSKVKFSFTNTFDNVNYSIKVRNIQMTAPETGTIDLTAGEYVWDELAGETTLNYGDTTAIAEMGDTISPADERLTIPAGDTQEYIVTFDVDLYVGSTLAKTYNKKSEISGIELEAGKAYNFAANINAESLNLDKVVFDANVDEWVEDTGAPQFTPYTVEVDGVNYDNLAEAVVKAMEFNKPVKFFQHVAIDADTTITVPAGKTLALELNGYTLTGVTDQTDSNRNMFDVRGTMTVDGAPLTRAADGNGCINIKHIGTNMGWGASTNVFNVTAGGVLNLENVTAKNLGGSDMAFVAHLNNWGEVTLNVENCTLESNYVPVRVFNSGYDMNNVTINNSTLKGGSAAFWVHNYTAEDFGSETKAEAQKALLNFDIYNGTNTFSPDVNGIRYGMTNSVRADSYGITKRVSEDGTEVTLGSMTDNGVVRRGVAGTEENTTIKKAVVGEGITTLYDRTFRRFYALEEVVLPSTLTTIGATGSGVFQSCNALKSIVIPESVTVLGKGSFQECSSLESINIPAGITRIEENALRATGLVSVEFHKGVTYFGAQAFRDCKQLKEVFINAPEFTVEPNAFGVMSGPLPGTTIYVANAEMKAYLENTLAYKNQFKVVVYTSTVVSNADELKAAIINGGNIEFANDITVDKWIMFSEDLSVATGDIITVENINVSIDGKGHTLTVKAIESAGNNDQLFQGASVLNISNLTIKYADGLTYGGLGMDSGVIKNVHFIGGGSAGSSAAIFPHDGEIKVKDCIFDTNGAAFYFDDECDNLTVTGCTFNQKADKNVILLRGDVKFTNNTINSGRTVNVVSGSPVVTGNNFNDVRFKVYGAATATISNNIINNLEFNGTTYASTFSGNTLSAAAQAVLDAATKVN